MDRFHQMRVFVAVAETEGFAAGARQLDISPPAVTRAIAALEERLGVRLLHRTTRQVRVTEAGQRYLDDARRILAEADEADEAATGLNAEPSGHLAVTAPVLFGRLFVVPGIVEYLERFPDTTVSAMLVDRIVNLLDEGMDVSVRIGELPDSSMRALLVGSVRMVLCAAPSYLARCGVPHKPDDLLEHSTITSSATSQSLHWRFPGSSGKRALRIWPRLTVNTNDSAIAAAVAGLGVTRLLSYQVAEQLATGELNTVLHEHEPQPWPVHIVHREGRQGSAKTRAFVDLLAQRLRADSALN